MNTYDERLLSILQDKRLSAQGLRIIILLHASVEFGSFAPLCPAQIARLLHADPSSVKRTLRKLVEIGYIKKRHQSEKLVGYEMLNL
jgi:DNA-binding MarR family transcriptional regulator